MNVNALNPQTKLQVLNKDCKTKNVSHNRVAESALSFKGAMRFPKESLTLNPLFIACISVASFVIKKIGSFDRREDSLFKDCKYHSFSQTYSNVAQINKGDSEITRKHNLYSFNYNDGEKYQAKERGTITFLNGDVYEYENTVETPPHSYVSENSYYRPTEEHYENYLKAHSLESIYSKALVDDKTYDLNNITLKKAE